MKRKHICSYSRLLKVRLLLIAFLVLITSGLQAQTITLNFESAPLKAVLKSITDQTGYKFVYVESVISNDQTTTVNISNQDIKKALDELFKNTDISYSIVNKQIALSIRKKTENKTTNESSQVIDQVSKKVSGQVLDKDGLPLAGVSVYITGTSIGTITDESGLYTLTVKNTPNATLTFKYIGMENKVVPIGKATKMNIVLESDRTALEQVVVTGYQTISKERATGSFDIIDKALLDKPAANIASRLIGSAAGLVGTQDAYGNPVFEIRGRTSLSTEATQPLLVVDGFAIEGGFESINPNDVESITVLKDAAAASIWGAKSANGVIVITTKQGKFSTQEGGTSVSVDFSGFYKVSPKLDLDYTLSRTSSSDAIDYERLGYGKWDSSVWLPEENSYSGGFSSVYSLLSEHRLGHISEQVMNERIDWYRQYNNTSQLKKHLLQSPMIHQENISINISTKRSTNALSVMYQDEQKHFKRQGTNKYSVGFRNTTHLFKWLDISLNGSYMYDQQDNSGYSMDFLRLYPYEMLYDENNELIRYSSTVWLSYINRKVPIEKFPYQDWSWNPVEEQNSRSLKSTSSNVRMQAGLKFKIWEGLSLDSKIQYEMIEGTTSEHYKESSYFVRNTVNSATTWNKSNNEVSANLPKGGILDQKRNRIDVITVRNQLNFNQTFANKHAIAFIGGIETIGRTNKTFLYPRTYGYDSSTLGVGNFPNGVGGAGVYKITNWQGSNLTFDYQNKFTHYTDRYFSAFGNLSYTYNRLYTISGSVQSDASNLITDDPAYRYSPFWSIGASWQISNESFMKEIPWINNLNIRTTYGYNGNVDKSTTFKPLLSMSSNPNVLTGEMTARIASYANPELRWEKTGTWDIGIDFNMFNGKLFGKLDIYQKQSRDLIANMIIPALQGTTSMKLNNGELSNKGFELEVGSSLTINKDIAWRGSLSIAYNKNRIKTLKVKPTAAYQLVYSGGTSAWMEGYDMNTLWGYQYGGLMNVGTEASPNWQPTILHKSGQRETFQAWNSGEPLDNSYDLGTKVAPWNFSLLSTFKLYDFDLSFIITGKFGHKFFRESFNYPSMSGKKIPNSKYDEIKNSDPNERVPFPLNDDEPRYYFWDRFYPYLSYLAEDASHIRFQEISVTYNIPPFITKKLKMDYLQVYLQCNNPFNIYFNKYNEDPEFKKGSMRLQASYTIGLKFRF